MTQLSYYYDGLSRTEVAEAVKKLLAMGENAQRTKYASWYDLSCKSMMSEEDRIALDMIDKIDLSNKPQLDLLWKHYHLNLEVINFWLGYCVFPTETMQYPSSLVANAWHLADNSHLAVGFSGTNDNHRLLPLQVQQRFPEETLSTNGKMLSLVLANLEYKEMSEHNSPDAPQWQRVLDCVAASSTQALIDCGALITGVTSKDACTYLLQKGTFEAAVFFQEGFWMVMERSGRMSRLSSSRICKGHFIYFDEACCPLMHKGLPKDTLNPYCRPAAVVWM